MNTIRRRGYFSKKFVRKVKADISL
jgi:hypothetical protein